MEKISVIVPVYKAEQYLDQCVASIAGQTYENLEIILVDDGSPDRCGAMCDAWAEKDSRVRVIHQENGGLSDARNAGMAVATGELMGFIDSDDWIEPNMYELLWERMQRDGADISACGIVLDWEDGRPSRPLTPAGNRILDRWEALDAIVQEDWLKQPVVYKLYKCEQVRQIPFATGKKHEDVFWSYQAIGEAEKVSVFDTCCYHYLQRDDSIMGVQYSLSRLDAIEAQCERLEYLTQRCPALVASAKIKLWFTCLYMGQMSLRHMEVQEREEAFRRLQQTLEEHPLRREDLAALSVKQRLWLQQAGKSFHRTCQIRNALHVGV